MDEYDLKAIRDDFDTSLEGLELITKHCIQGFTELLTEDLDPKVVEVCVGCLERRLERAKPQFKLPCVYLIDSIVKKTPIYRKAFQNKIVGMLADCFQAVDTKTKLNLQKVRKGWKDTECFPPHILNQLDVVLEIEKPEESLLERRKSQNIHINPQFAARQQQRNSTNQAREPEYARDRDRDIRERDRARSREPPRGRDRSPYRSPPPQRRDSERSRYEREARGDDRRYSNERHYERSPSEGRRYEDARRRSPHRVRDERYPNNEPLRLNSDTEALMRELKITLKNPKLDPAKRVRYIEDFKKSVMQNLEPAYSAQLMQELDSLIPRGPAFAPSPVNGPGYGGPPPQNQYGGGPPPFAPSPYDNRSPHPGQQGPPPGPQGGYKPRHPQQQRGGSKRGGPPPGAGGPPVDQWGRPTQGGSFPPNQGPRFAPSQGKGAGPRGPYPPNNNNPNHHPNNSAGPGPGYAQSLMRPEARQPFPSEYNNNNNNNNNSANNNNNLNNVRSPNYSTLAAPPRRTDGQSPAPSLGSIKSLLSKLKSPMSASPLTGRPTPSPKKEIQIDLSNAKTLKERHDFIIKSLYDDIPTPCPTCGLRFLEEEQDSLKQHMDWHFRTNSVDKELSNNISFRRWFLSEDNWISFQEVDMATEIESFDDEKEEDEIEEVSCSQGDEPDDCRCGVCTELFERIYHKEKEEWHFRFGVRQGGKIYHQQCVASISEETPEKRTAEEENDSKVFKAS